MYVLPQVREREEALEEKKLREAADMAEEDRKRREALERAERRKTSVPNADDSEYNEHSEILSSPVNHIDEGRENDAEL